MGLSIDDKIKLIDSIYQDFLKKAKNIETERDQRIASLFQDDDQKEIQKILKSIKKTV